jgi:hypothetical protein
MTDVNDDLAAWRDDWQRPDPHPVASDSLVAWARRRRPMLVVWIIGELTVALAGLLIVGYVFIARADPVERVAMGGLALMCGLAAVFSWWNWRGAVRASAETTTVYLELTARRLIAMRREVMAGWVILGIELLLLTPWVGYRLATRSMLEARPVAGWPWALLVTMSAFGVVALILMGRWVSREARLVEQLRQDLTAVDIDSA